MKKIFYGVIALAFISLSSFTKADSKDDVLHNCRYRMYSNGTFVGYYNFYDVPNDVPCNAPFMMQGAMDCYNYGC